MPIVNMMKNEYRPVFSTTMPCSARYLVTMDAGMPLLSKSPSTPRPGVMIVLLIGSSMLKPGARLPKPCQSSLASSTQFEGVGDSSNWVLEANEDWHGFGNLAPGFNMLDPIKSTIITPGLDVNGNFDKAGIP